MAELYQSSNSGASWQPLKKIMGRTVSSLTSLGGQDWVLTGPPASGLKNVVELSRDNGKNWLTTALTPPLGSTIDVANSKAGWVWTNAAKTTKTKVGHLWLDSLSAKTRNMVLTLPESGTP